MHRLFPLLAPMGLAACMPTATVEPVAAPQALSSRDLLDMSEICFRETATEDELAGMALGGETGQAVARQVLQRPATLACLQELGINLPGAIGT